MTTKRKHTPNQPRNRKFFTLEEARRALPYVSRIVRDITACYSQVMDLRSRLEMPRPEDIGADLQKEYEAGAARLNDLVEELRVAHVAIKDFDRGLIDFPAWHDGREICLCWQLGESTIHAWHETDAGFAGRQDVSLLEPIGAGDAKE